MCDILSTGATQHDDGDYHVGLWRDKIISTDEFA